MTIEERVTQSRLAQGLPARVEDAATLARIAQILKQATERTNTREVIRCKTPN